MINSLGKKLFPLKGASVNSLLCVLAIVVAVAGVIGSLVVLYWVALGLRGGVGGLWGGG